MKAVIYETYGGPEVLKLVELPIPVPSKNEVLIKIMSTSATTADWRLRSLSMPRGFYFLARLIFGFNKPRQKILGTELSGLISAVGNDVTKFKVGDKVIAQVGAKLACYAEYRCMNENQVILPKPESLSFEEAATLSFGATTAWVYLAIKSPVTKGQKVLINGASGSVGTAAIQIAKYFGAQVTAICSSQNFALVKSLGADFVIDYNESDFTLAGKTYDKIMDNLGNLQFSKIKNSLTKNGQFLVVSGDLAQLLTAPLINLTNAKKIISTTVPEDLATLKEVLKLIDTKQFKPVLDKIFTIDEIVQAHAYLDKRHRKGNIAIKVSN